MKKNLLLERQETAAEIVAEGTNNEGKEEVDVEVLWQRADVVNGNNRLYPRRILSREVDKINKRIEAGESIWGNAFHPADAFGKPTEVSHKWKRVWMEPDGTCKGILSLVGTRVGNDMKALIRAGKVGISSRGIGTTTAKKTKAGKEYLAVNDDYEMTTPGDFVVAPSVKGAGTLDESFKLYESQLSEAGEEKQEIEDKKMITSDTIIEVYKKAKAKGDFTGTLVEFKSLHPELIPEEENPVKQAIKKKSEKKEKKRVTSADVYDQARAAGIDPKEYARIVNEDLEREERGDKERQTRIMREAKIASYNRSPLAPSSPKDPTRTDRGPDPKISRSSLPPLNPNVEEEVEPEPPKHVFKTRKEILEIAEKPLSPEAKNMLERQAKSKAEAAKDEFLRNERLLAGKPRKKNLEERIQDLGEAINRLNDRLEKLGE